MEKPMTSFALTPLTFEPIVRAALEEDLGRAGDVTSQAIIPANMDGVAVMAARKDGVIAGLPIAEAAFRLIDSDLVFDRLVEEGARVAAGTPVARVRGGARAILTAERVALNFVCRLSGIASLTARYVDLIRHTQAKVCETRKTTPNLRTLEKYAVRCGGGANHRFGLDDAFLIKDNHIAVAGGVGAALRAAKAAAGHLVKIEIEVDALEQLAEVIAEGADAVLFDNMSAQMIRQGVEMIQGRMATEASGGIDLTTARAIAETGVDILSVGALTHSAPILDLGLDIELG
jgi:nicotinate-nucleotide pyrophosphorylase (carboxylating)